LLLDDAGLNISTPYQIPVSDIITTKIQDQFESKRW